MMFRKFHNDLGSLSRLTLKPQPAVQSFYPVFYNRKAKTGSSDFLGVTFIHPVKTLKDAFLIFFRNTDSRIPHIYTNYVSFILQPYKNFSTLMVIFDSIISDIVENFFHNRRHGFQHGTSTFHIHMHFLLPGSFM